MWYLVWNQDTNHALVLKTHIELHRASLANVAAHGQTIVTDVAVSVTSMEIGAIPVAVLIVATKGKIHLRTATRVLMRESSNLILFQKKDRVNPVYFSIPADFT